MPAIVVPVPSPEAFNKNRRISDLLQSQLTHFQHLALVRSLDLDPALAREAHTEAGAARYIAAVTRAVRMGSAAPSPTLMNLPAGKRPAPMAGKRPAPMAGTLPRLAAGAESAASEKPSKSRRAPKGKTP